MNSTNSLLVLHIISQIFHKSRLEFAVNREKSIWQTSFKPTANTASYSVWHFWTIHHGTWMYFLMYLLRKLLYAFPLLHLIPHWKNCKDGEVTSHSGGPTFYCTVCRHDLDIGRLVWEAVI